MEEKKIAIVGIGAIGSILSAFIVKAGYNPCLIDVSIDKRSSLAGKEFTLHDPNHFISGDFVVAFPAIHGSVSALVDLRIDYLFVCVKTPFLDSLLQNLENVIAPNTVIISFQNGLGTEDRIAERFGRNKTLRAVINFAGSLNGHNQANLAFFQPPNYIGFLDPELSDETLRIAKILSDIGLKTENSADLDRHIWTKVILNAALSPVTALTGLTMADSMGFDDTRRLAGLLLEEGIAVAMAQGIGLGDDFFEKAIGYLGKGGRHKASMAVDLDCGNPTEIEYINAKIVEYGQRTNIPTPYNKAITMLIRGAEYGRRSK